MTEEDAEHVRRKLVIEIPPIECCAPSYRNVAIANPAFVPDAWRIQEDRVAGPARALLNAAV